MAATTKTELVVLAEVGELLLFVYQRIKKKKPPARGSGAGDGIAPPEGCSDGDSKIRPIK